MRFLKFALLRFTATIFSALSAATIFFMIMRSLPTDPVCYIVPNCLALTTEQKKEIYAKLWGDKSFAVQFINWLLNILRGNLGTSISTARPVIEIIKESGKYSMIMIVISFALSLLLSFLLCILAPILPTLRKYLSKTLFVFDMPIFILSYILILWFSNISSEFIRATLCCTTITLSNGVISRLLRTGLSIIDRVSNDEHSFYSSFFFKKKFIVLNYTIRSAMIGILGEYLFVMRHFVGSLVIAEAIFSYPGIGKTLIDSLLSHDYPLLLSIVMILSIIVSLGIFILNISIYFLSGRRIHFRV